MRSLVCLALSACSLLLAESPARDASELSWMAGCWTTTAGPLVVEEHWSKPSGGAMLGWSRTLKSGRMVFHEFMRIAPADGKLVYHARTGSTGGGTPFVMTASSADMATFENPAHDFPQRIIYKVVDGELLARIEGSQNGKLRSQEFPMKRTACN